uniref:Calcineurin-like phosphoesterase n=1 Tax=Candidatus Kentrum sp. FM TaxID=2126340 RepID=A0A450S9M8_9GAMM|nr:MAG: Calcineurin-like phosphoesterase [Candidatus Kentron sp. FM]VFJ48689.1 MAG: Calcineurin-like phosphoesterase [Candidatus Kentron sp. FM]VFK07584.1 MAG: Calcineurin-like phosphoesterase [Candidatus Kentron sp. FM]
MPRTITWLHLSDLHLCGPKTGWDADRILKFLIENLKHMEADHGLAPGLLLVTGDLAFGHLGEGELSLQSQFDEAALFLQEVRDAFTTPIPAERVFLVPGNHDVDRRRVLPSQTLWLDHLVNEPDPARTVNEMLRDASGDWPGIMQRLAVYKQFLGEHYPHLLQDPEDEKHLCYAHTLDVHGHKLGIAGFNSAWSCGRDGEKGKLWLGGEWQSNTLSGKLEDAEIKLLLAHHPLSWLVEQETPKLDPQLENDFHFFLHGHEHQGWVDPKPRHIRLAAGACYGETPTESGYGFARLDPEAGKGEVWLRRFDDMGLGWIPRVIPGWTNNGGLWKLELGWLAPKATARVNKHPPENGGRATTGPLSPQRRQEKERAHTAASPVAQGSPASNPAAAPGEADAGTERRPTPAPGEADAGAERRPTPASGEADARTERPSTPGPGEADVGTERRPAPEITPDAPESRGIFGRGPEIAKLARQLAETPILLVHGMAGIGKSCLIDEVHRALGDARSGGGPGEGESYRLVSLRATSHLGADEIFGQLAPVLKCFDDEPKAPRHLGRLHLEGLAKYRGAAPTVLHIYRVHNAFAEDGFRDVEVRIFLGGLVKQLPQFRVVLESTRAAPEALFPDGAYHVHRVRGLAVDAVQGYFRRPFVKNPRLGWELTEEQALEIHDRLGGRNKKEGAHPLGMTLLAVLADGLALDPSQVLERHPGKLRKKLEEDLFNDLYGNVLTPAQQHLLRLVALYRQSIPMTHEAALDGRAGEPGAFRALEERFLLSPDEREERFDLHSLFADLTQARIAPGGLDYQRDHEVIAEAWLATVRGIRTRRLPYLLAANEAAFHLLEAEEFHRLDELSVSLLGRDTPGILEAWYQRLFESGDREKQRPVLELLTKLLPDEHKYHRFLGETIENLDGRGADEALEHYRKAHELLPTYPQYLANLGRCWLARDEPERFIDLVVALSDFERERAVDAHVHDIHSKCLERMGEGEAASRNRQEQIRQGRATAPLYNDEADYLGKQRRYPAALSVLDKAEQAGVMNDHLRAVKAGILQADGQGEAASRLRRARMAAGINNAVFYNDEALYQWQERDDPNAALAVLEQAEEHRCANDHTLAVKAKLLEAMGRGAEGSRLRQARINAQSRHAAFYNDEAVWLRDRGDFEAALALLELAQKHGCANEATRNIRRSIEQRKRQTPP